MIKVRTGFFNWKFFFNVFIDLNMMAFNNWNELQLL